MNLRYNTIITVCFLTFISFGLKAQSAWIEPDPKTAAFSPSKEATIYVDVTKTDCADLAELEDLYMWTWRPNELPEGNPKHNGSWDASNETLKFTNEGNGIFSYTMIPTEFYEVSASEVYENDFSFLAKALNGAGGSTTCPEDKTEDLTVEAEPFVLAKKVFSFPEAATTDTLFITPDDYITIFFDKSQEEKDNILAAENYNIFLKARGDDGIIYTYASATQLDNTPELAMTPGEDEKFYWTVQPTNFLKDKIPSGVKIASLVIQIAIEGASSGADLVDGTYEYHYKCR